ncbi:MAG: PilZ domain-containing protein [Hyphomicrobiaceae bacterium]
MSAMNQLTTRPEHIKGATNISEVRRYKRVDLTLLGRYLRRITREEFTCRLSDISIGGAGLYAEAAPQVGETIVVYFDELGGLEGEVVRSEAGNFAINFTASHRRRQKLAAQITWLINRHELALADQRRAGHERIALARKPVEIKLEDGSSVDHNVLDVSISGASIDMPTRPAIGTTLTVGKLPAKVVRHHNHGVGVEFITSHHFDFIREEFG